MMAKQYLILIILCIAALCQTNSCPGYNIGDLLQSGKNAILRGNIGGNPQYIFESPINFPIPSSGLQIAVTTGTIGDYNPLPNYGYNYFIEASRKPNSNSIIYKLIMNNDQSWTSVQLSYLVSARLDLSIGNFESPIEEWTSLGANIYSIQKNINKVLPKTSYKVATFLSGFSTTDSQFTLTITRKSYQVDAKKLTIVFYSTANPAVLTVTFSYIIYPETQPVLDIVYDLTPKGDVGSYQISGPVNFQPNKRIQYNQWRVENRNLPCTGNECSNTCVLRQECAKLNGNIYEGQCIYCSPGIIFQFGRCSRRCGANQIYLNKVCFCARGFTRKGKDCLVVRSCGPNQVYSDSLNSCVCNKDSINFNGECRPCPLGSSPTADGTSCFCSQNYNIYDINANICKNRCTENQIWSNNKCSCLPQYSLSNQICKKCPDNALVSNDQTTCLCKSSNAYFYAQTYTCMECLNGYVLNQGKSSCICPEGFSVKNGACTINCKDYQIYNPNTNICQCKAGETRAINGTCESVCNGSQVWINNVCSCAPEFVRINGSCKQCPSGSIANDLKTACVCANPNQIFVAEEFNCISCLANSSPNQDKTICVCNQGFIINSGSCIRNCKDPEFLNVQTGNCDCKLGFLRDANGTCRSRCPAEQTWDGKNCLCQPGYARYENCKLCPPDTLPNSLRTSCICTDPNQIFAYDKFSCHNCPPNSKPNTDLTQCLCKNGYIKQGTSCILNCGLNEQPNNNAGRCDCIFGFHKPDNKCVARCTNPNQEWNGSNCICKPGSGIFNQVCTTCPKDSIANAARTSCHCVAPNYIFNTTNFRCQLCQLNSHNNIEDTQCICNLGFEPKVSICSPICNFNQALNAKTNECDCKFGYLRLGPLCVQRCGLNQQWDGSKCLCKQNHIFSAGVCRPCPEGTQTNAKRTNCICKINRQLFDLDKFTCTDIPTYSALNDDVSDFVCYPGYKREAQNCVNTCPSEALPDSLGNCVCTNGYYIEANTCKRSISCPSKSTWNPNTLACVCDTQGQNLINGICQKCGENSLFLASTSRCVCNTGFFLIGGQCRICDSRTKYNGTDCICNLGYFGNRDKCDSCHDSCSICSGPEANQCQSCSDVSLVLQNGFCSKNNPCDPGFYLSDSSCTKCSDNCIICDDIFQCQQCANGYLIQKFEIEGQKVQACSEICGDGIKYQAQCDDGNNKNGDGCSDSCTVEQGWSCSGGSSAQKSKCIKYIPDQSIFTSKGIVNLGDKVVLAVRTDFLPSCLTVNECSKCFKILQVNVVNANVPILVKVNFVPFSQYQFLIQYNFQGLIVTSKFKTVIKLNPEFKGCLADDDFSQQIELDIDPSFLALVDNSDTLSFGDINGTTELPEAAKSILGVKQ